MPIFNRLKHGVDITKFKADQLMRVNRTLGEIEELKQRIAGVHKQLAIAAYGLHQRGELTNPELTQLCQEIDQFKINITEKEALVAAIRAETPPELPPEPVSIALNPCPNCGWDVPPEAEFCTNCGKPYVKPEITPPATCPKCQHQLEPNAVFCINCGFKLSQPDSPTPVEEQP